MNPCYSLLAVVLLGACAGPREALVVKQFQLRDQESGSSDQPMVKMEKDRRLHGAVSMAERRNKLGQYFTLLWHDPAGVNQGKVEVIFQYQQGASASRVKRMVREFPPAMPKAPWNSPSSATTISKEAECWRGKPRCDGEAGRSPPANPTFGNDRLISRWMIDHRHL